MSGTVLVAIISGAFGLAVVAISLIKGSKTDKALNATRTIELSLTSLQQLNTNLSQQLTRQETATANCQARCDELAEENIQLQDKHEAMRIALNATKTVVGEHEETITRQQREISRLRIELEELRKNT